MAQTMDRSRRLLRLDEAEPRTGQSLLFEGREWTVTEQATYRSAEGYQVHEWCCEAEGTTAYLLKERDPGQSSVRWFFTREIDAAGVFLAGGDRLREWLARDPELSPPPALVFQGATYHYEDTTEGTHEDDSGERVLKITWDYWDAGRHRNLALERWPDRSLDAYLGASIEPAQVGLRTAEGPEAAARPRWNPFASALTTLPVVYAVGFFLGWPFDEALTLAMFAGAAAGWLAALSQAPAVALAALVMAAVGAGVYGQFPPLTSAGGLAVVLGTPVVIGWLAQRRGHAGKTGTVRYAAAFAAGTPILGIGSYAYFRWAPGPHTPDQLVLALGPAAVAALAGVLVAGLIARSHEAGSP